MRGAAYAFGLVVLAVLELACAGSASSKRDASLYAAQLVACVETSQTLEESKKCRERVMRVYDRLDGGVK